MTIDINIRKCPMMHEIYAVLDFVGRYIDGGKFVVYNGINQFLADFDTLADAIYYKEENEPKNVLFSIECEILN